MFSDQPTSSYHSYFKNRYCPSISIIPELHNRWMDGYQVAHYCSHDVVIFLENTRLWPSIGGNFETFLITTKLDLIDSSSFTLESGTTATHGSELVNKALVEEKDT